MKKIFSFLLQSTKLQKKQALILLFLSVIMIGLYFLVKIFLSMFFQYVQDFSPKGECPINSKIEITLNKPFISKVPIGQPLYSFPIKIEPPTSGYFKWETK